MKRETLEKIIAEVETHIDKGTTSMWPATAPQAATNYSDPAVMEREKQLIKSSPIIVGHSSRLKAAGDFFTHDDSGVPIIVARQEDGTLRAMLNVCRHRGARVCTKTEGQRKTFVCPYHAWTYKLDGSLRAMPMPDGFSDLNKADHGLLPLPVEERHGFIWVVPTPGASIDVAAHLGALDEELGAYEGADMVLQRQDRLTEDMNWKFVLDGFLEVYHFPVVHSKTIAPYFFGNHSPFDTFGKHGRMVGVRASLEKIRGLPKDGISKADLIKHLAINYYIFPNTVLVWQGDHFECWTSFPGERPDHSSTQIQSVVPVSMATPELEARWNRNWDIMVGTVVAEDWAMSKTIQQSIHAMPNNRIVFGRNEPGLQHFHGQLTQELDAQST